MSTRAGQRVQPFPWHALASTTRLEAAILRGLGYWAARNARLEAFALAAQELLGAKLELRARRARGISESRSVEPGAVGVLIAPAEGRADEWVLVEAEGALAVATVARAIRRTPPVTAVDRATTAEVAGAFAALVAAAARRAHRGQALRVRAAGPAASLLTDLTRAQRDLVAATFTVIVGDDAFGARAVFPRSLAVAAPDPPWTREDLAALGPLPLSLPMVAAAVRLRAADVGALGRGDALMTGGWPLSRGSGGAWSGPVLLCPPSVDVGVRATFCDDGRIVLGARADPLRATEVDMNEASDNEALLTAVGEVPVVVRVEIGEARMAAREWASLRSGDVIALGRRVGEQVVLRVGGVPVARGELVEVEGEVGVRVVERIDEGRTAR